MKTHTYIQQLVLALCLCLVSQAGLLAKPLPKDWYEKLVQSGLSQLEARIRQNAQNEALGQAGRNSYIITLGQDPLIQEGKHSREQGIPAYRLLSEARFRELDGFLQEIHQEPALQEARAGYYVLMVNHLEAYLETQVTQADLQRVKDLVAFKAWQNANQQKQLSQLQHRLGQLSHDILAELKKKGYGETYAYLYGRVTVHYPGSKADRLKTQSFYYASFAPKGQYHSEAVREKLSKLRPLLDQFNSSGADVHFHCLMRQSRLFRDAYREIQAGSQEPSLDELLFSSQVLYQESSRRFAASLQVLDLHERPGQVPEKLEGGPTFLVADYVGLEGKRLLISTQSEMGALMAKLAQRVKVCLTNPQSPAVVRDFLEKGLSTTAPTDFGNFFQLEEGEMLLWVHFPKPGEAQLEFSFASSLIPEVAAFLQKERENLVRDGFAASMQAVKAVSDLLSATIKGGQIPEAYWNAAHPTYAPGLKLLMEVLSGDVVGESKSSPNLAQLQFALFAGAYNQTLTEVAAISDLVSLLTAYLSDAQVRQSLHQALGEVSFKKVVQGLAQGAIRQGDTFAQLNCKSAHLLGQDMVAVLSMVIGFGEIKAAVQSGSFVKNLGKLAVSNGQNYLRLLSQIKKMGVKVIRQGQQTFIYAGQLSQQLLARIEEGLLHLERQAIEMMDGKHLGTFEDIAWVTPDGKQVRGKVELWEDKGRVYMKGEGEGSGKRKVQPDYGILIDVNRDNYEALFKEIAQKVKRSGNTSNCTSVSASVALKLRKKPILDDAEFTLKNVGGKNAEYGLLNLKNKYKFKEMKSYLKGDKPYMIPFNNRSSPNVNLYPGGINNRVTVERILEQLPNGSSLIFASYKGMHSGAPFQGHAFNVLKDRDSKIKYIDAQISERMEYGEGIEKVIAKINKHGKINGKEGTWHVFDGSDI